MREFDLVVIGAGPGGYVAAIRASQLGLKVAVAEKDRPGGVCVNWGCIPSKAILKVAGLYEDMKHAAGYGLRCEGLSADYGAVVRRSRQVAERMSRGVAYLFRKNGIELIRGTASVTSPRSVRVGAEELSARNILVATGTAVRGLPGIEPDGRTILSSDDALALETLPRSVAVLGGGAVGLEFGYIFRTFGAEVTVVEMTGQLLPRVDTETARELEGALRKQGIRIMTSASATGYDPGSGRLTVVAGEREETITAGKLLVAVGRRPLSGGIGLEACGVRTERGYILTDGAFRTDCPSIWAIGDVIGGLMLAHEASAEGVAAAERIAGREVRVPDRDRIPACVYCRPEVAVVGLSEEEARRRGVAYRVGKFPFAALGRAVASGHTEGFVKVVVGEKYGELLGCHIVGHGASDMIAEACLGMSLEATWREAGAAVHPHPSLSEALREAALAAGGEAIDI